jgi:ABC-2 type transport system permease protein
MPGYIGLAMGLALWSAAMTGAGILLNSVIEEKSSRILEVLLSSASVPQIMGGKILGVAGVTATVLGMWGIISSVVLASQQPQWASIVMEVLLSRGLLFYFLFYFLAGYIMYATLFVTVGAFCETSREAQTLLGPMMIVLIVPMLFLTQAITQPDSPMLRGLSWVPLFAPFLMAARAANEPPLWEVIGTGSLLIATVAAEVWIAGRAFKAGALSTSRFDVRYFFASLMGRSAT